MRDAAPRLSDADLRLFITPCSWAFLSLVNPRRSDAWWRDAILDADEHGRGLLVWCKSTKRWRLSARGREHLGLAPVIEA